MESVGNAALLMSQCERLERFMSQACRAIRRFAHATLIEQAWRAHPGRWRAAQTLPDPQGLLITVMPQCARSRH
jgi:hypothetical protein